MVSKQSSFQKLSIGKNVFCFLILVYAIGCSGKYKEKLVVDEVKPTLINSIDPKDSNAFYDSLANTKVDTSTIKGKMQYLKNQLLIEIVPAGFDVDTLFDVNYDGYKDLVLGWYGLAGSGIKNRAKVFNYDPHAGSFILNEQLSLTNASFYIKRKKITGFYLPAGGGGGIELKWAGNKWDTVKKFSVSTNNDTSKWEIDYPQLKRKETIIRPYVMIPPPEILETNVQ